MSRNAPRSYPPAAYNSLKTAWKALALRLGGLEAVASCTRAITSRASEYGSPSSERFAPVDVILDAETVAGAPLVTAALARLQGYDLVPVDAQGDGELSHVQARIGRDASAFFATALEAIERGTITEADRDLLIAELEELRRDCCIGMQALRGLAQFRPGGA